MNLRGFLAVWTGLEPATPCVTGRYSNQLNYQTFFLIKRKISYGRYNNLILVNYYTNLISMYALLEKRVQM